MNKINLNLFLIAFSVILFSCGNNHREDVPVVIIENDNVDEEPSTSKTTIEILKDEGWTELTEIKAIDPYADDISDFEKFVVILYKDNHYAAIKSSDKYDEHSPGYSPILLRVAKGNFRISDEGSYYDGSTYTGRVTWGNGTYYYFDF